ncbi:MAG: MBL fold metallo-hydrolase [Planctomycetes bacterium]|nr:MBL fold metallo-hydrolase [Planctomycetota bacterium]
MAQPARQIQIGRFKITALRDRDFALDGGAMFGVVPRVLWQKMTPVNEDHTIPLATTPFLVEVGEHKIVIEPGLGRRWNEKQQLMFRMDASDGKDLLQSLQGVGIAPEEITHCLMTHCHWDHIGAVCDENGKPVFGNAQHWAPQVEAQICLKPDHLRKASYRSEDLQPVVTAGLLQTFENEKEILPGMSMHLLGGHSDGASVILIQDEEAKQTACFWGDVVPTRNHVHLPFIMAYDIHAEGSYQARKQWIPRAVEENWTCLLYHDPVSPIGIFQKDSRRFFWQVIEG